MTDQAMEPPTSDSLRIEFLPNDVVQIEGVKYACELFRDLGLFAAVGDCFQIDKREEGVVWLRSIPKPVASQMEANKMLGEYIAERIVKVEHERVSYDRAADTDPGGAPELTDEMLKDGVWKIGDKVVDEETGKAAMREALTSNPSATSRLDLATELLRQFYEWNLDEFGFPIEKIREWNSETAKMMNLEFADLMVKADDFLRAADVATACQHKRVQNWYPGATCLDCGKDV